MVRNYRGTQIEAYKLFEKEAGIMAENRYFPKSQDFQQGRYGCSSFLIALILCFIVIGIVIFIYMLIVPPQGILTVTYEYREKEKLAEKPCPQCAELVKEAAKICRFCQYKF